MAECETTSGPAMTPERQRRLQEIEDQLLTEEADRGQAELIVKINRHLGRRTDPAIIALAQRRSALMDAALDEVIEQNAGLLRRLGDA